MRNSRTIAALAGTASLGVMMLASAAPAFAQDEEAFAIEEIVITAQKREEKMQNVPITLTAFSNKSLDVIGAQNISDLDKLTPGLDVSASSPTQPRFSMRGVQTNDFSSGVEPAVGIYIDGIYAARSGSGIVFLNDIERVEVLKGPQGTLFGRNTAAGAISIITKKPQLGEFEANAKLTYGNYDKKRAMVTVNVPLGETVAIRANGVVNRRDGLYLDNRSGQKWNNEHSNSGRIALRWQPATSTTFDVAYDHDRTDQYARYLIGFGPYSPNGTDMTPPYKIENDANNNNETRTLDNVSLTVTHNMDWATLTSISNYKKFSTTNREDEDGTARYDYYLDTDNQERNKQWYQELRLNGDTGNVKWTAGFSYFKEKGQQHTFLNTNTNTVEHLVELQTSGAPCLSDYTDLVSDILQSNGVPIDRPTSAFFCSTPAAAALADPSLVPIYTALQTNSIFSALDGLLGDYGFGINGRGWHEDVLNTANFEAWAGFADATWAATDQLNLTAGVRWTKDKKTYGWLNGRRTIDGQGDMTLLGLDYNTLVDMLTQETDLLMPGSFNLSKKASWSNVSPRFVADYKWSDDVMTFIGLAFGYKAGGFNFNQPNSEFAPEKVWNLEGGVKADWLDGRLRTNLSIYRYLYKDMQEASLIGSSTVSIPQYQISSSDQRATGIDFEVKFAPVRDLVLSMAGGYIDAEWKKRTDYCNIGGISTPIDSSGENRGGPTTRLVFSADYGFNLGENDRVDFHADHSFTSKPRQTTASQACDAGAEALYGLDATKLPGYNKARNTTNARISLMHADHIGISFWVENLFDNHYMGGLGGQASTLGTYTSAWDNMPRTYGFDVNAKF